MEEYTRMSEEYDFIKINGNDSIEDIHKVIKKNTMDLIDRKFN